mmetsp:Transcript_24243/g.81696  ORF Transcript_24243/g.81696 Transcript_24243/m.81696 type:complete len:138 (+) Transcript_24243:275-688(+)
MVSVAVELNTNTYSAAVSVQNEFAQVQVDTITVKAAVSACKKGDWWHYAWGLLVGLASVAERANTITYWAAWQAGGLRPWSTSSALCPFVWVDTSSYSKQPQVCAGVFPLWCSFVHGCDHFQNLEDGWADRLCLGGV